MTTEHTVVADAGRISNSLWQCMQRYLPAERPKPRGGRPRMPDRQAMEAILYVMRTGCRWKRIPRCLGAASTVHDRFREWEAAGVFVQLCRAGLLDDDGFVRLKTRHGRAPRER